MAPTAPPASLRPKHPVGATVAGILELTGARLNQPGGSGDVRLSGVTLRAQDVRPGDLFAALPGTRSHGSRYAVDAVAAG
ncbi:MAG TPA: Mur ligase domain-containing protein, partial [Nakamurella sp.]